MIKLTNMYENLQPGTFPPNILRGLSKAFVLAGVALHFPQNNTQMNRYFEMILTPIQSRFKALVNKEDFQQAAHNAETQRMVTHLLESLIGIARGAMMPSATLLFQFLAPILGDLPVFLTVYNNYQEIVRLILELFGQVAKYILCYLSPHDSKR